MTDKVQLAGRIPSAGSALSSFRNTLDGLVAKAKLEAKDREAILGRITGATRLERRRQKDPYRSGWPGGIPPGTGIGTTHGHHGAMSHVPMPLIHRG